MSRITTMSRATVKDLHAELDELLKAFAEDHGLTVKPEHCSFDPAAGTFTFKGTLVVQTASGIPADWIRYAPGLGLAKEDFGRAFKTASGTYTICGVAPKSHKYPVLANASNGRTYKFDAVTIRAALARAARA